MYKIKSVIRWTLLLFLIMSNISTMEKQASPQSSHTTFSEFKFHSVRNGALVSQGTHSPCEILYAFEKQDPFELVICNALTHEIKYTLKLDKNTVGIMEVSKCPNGLYFALGEYNCKINMYNANGIYLKEKSPSFPFPFTIEFSPNGTYVAAVCYSGGGSGGGPLTMWTTDLMQKFRYKNLNKKSWTSINFSADNKFLAAAAHDEFLRIFYLDQNKINFIHNDTGPIYSVRFNPTQKKLATGDTNGTINIWNNKTFTCCQTLKGHTKTVTAFGFSPDGKILVSGSKDQTIRIWDTERGTCLQTLSNETTTPPIHIVFDGTGSYFASTGLNEGTIKIWKRT